MRVTLHQCPILLKTTYLLTGSAALYPPVWHTIEPYETDFYQGVFFHLTVCMHPGVFGVTILFSSLKMFILFRYTTDHLTIN